MGEALRESAVTECLRERGVVDPATPLSVVPLPGGVSSTTVLVTAGSRRFVVKQPLPYLSVRDEWPARVERAADEADAIALLGRITPAALPRLVDYDPERHLITMTAAPGDWAEWRQRLLRGDVEVAAGTVLGRLLGAWHSRTEGDVEVRARYGDLTGFLELRGDPYHRTVATRCPDVAGPVLACLDELLRPAQAPGRPPRWSLVHGDFSPKNVLIAPGGARAGLWVLDFEVAHAGNPVFDVAFLLHHLVMKAVHLPAAGAWFFDCARAFLQAYAAAGGLATDEAWAMRHTGALLLARVHGKSPAAYLTEPERREVSRLGAAAVRGERADLTSLWPA